MRNRAGRRRRAATSARIVVSRPAPVATLAFFEIDDDRAGEPVGDVAPADSVTLGPAKRLRVNNAAAGARAVGGDDDEVVGVVLDADVGDVGRESPPGSSVDGTCRGERREVRPRTPDRRAGPALMAVKIDSSAATCVGVEVVEDPAAHACDVMRRGAARASLGRRR